MANNKSSIPGGTNAPGAAVSSTPLGSSAPAGGTNSGATAPGMGPGVIIVPPKGFQKTAQQILFGTSKDFPAGGSLPMGGQQVTPAQIQGILQPVLDAFTAIADAEKTVKSARLSLSALLPQAKQFAKNLKQALIAHFGAGSPILADFGVKDGTRARKKTVEAKAAAVVKGKQTRKLRGTQGKVEKLKTKFVGQVSAASAVPQGNGSGNTGSAPSGATGNGA